MSDIVERQRKRTKRTLPNNWRVDRKCPECDVEADRPKCMWDMGPSCPRHDPNAYDESPYVYVPDTDCTEAADTIEAIRAKLTEARGDARDEAVDFVFDELSKALGVPDVSRDAATETWDGDVRSVLYRILEESGVLDEENVLSTTKLATVLKRESGTTARCDARVAELEAENTRLREALRGLLDCPAISDGGNSDPTWGCQESLEAERRAREALKETK